MLFVIHQIPYKKVHVLYYQDVEVPNYVHVDDVWMESTKCKIV